MTGEDALPEIGLLEKSAKIKRFEYSPLGCELKKQTDAVGKQYQALNKVYEFKKGRQLWSNKWIKKMMIKHQKLKNIINKI